MIENPRRRDCRAHSLFFQWPCVLQALVRFSVEFACRICLGKFSNRPRRVINTNRPSRCRNGTCCRATGVIRSTWSCAQPEFILGLGPALSSSSSRRNSSLVTDNPASRSSAGHFHWARSPSAFCFARHHTPASEATITSSAMGKRAPMRTTRLDRPVFSLCAGHSWGVHLCPSFSPFLFPLLLPTIHQLMRQADMIQDPGHHCIRHLFDSLRHRIERRVGREDDRAGQYQQF